MTELDQTSSGTAISHLVLICLALADLGLIAIYLGNIGAEWFIGIPLRDLADLEGRNSLASSWNYGKYIFAISLLLPVAMVSGRFGTVWFGILLLVFLSDDVLEFHDKVGASLGERVEIGPLAEMSAQDKGEPFVHLVLLAIATVLLLLARWDMDGAWRPVWNRFAISIAALALVGAGLDVVHGLMGFLIDQGSMAAATDLVLVTLEEGGEMLVLSAILWVCIDTTLRCAASPITVTAPM